ncbi:hypothetical protein LCGC14_1599610 [marine sediment metagenome]|uniref:Uncharacterized protein n=1 Tax=marine sediment metagenome TaxID=412755 RepID=A0A0F9LBM2_9ZZZZ
MWSSRTLSALVISWALLGVMVCAASGAEFYVAENGSSIGQGTKVDPWDLQTALGHPAQVQPGDTIWVRGGTYQGDFVSTLLGESNQPIVVRQYPGERATIDLTRDGGELRRLAIRGAFTHFQGLEVTSRDPQRVTDIPGQPPEMDRGVVSLRGIRNKLINMVLHDLTDGVWWPTSGWGGEVYGSIIYNNGWQGPDRGHGHGIYPRNRFVEKWTEENIIFNQYGWGIHAYAETGDGLNLLHFEGNVSFGNGSVSEAGAYPNIFVGGEVAASQITIRNNFTYSRAAAGVELQLGYAASVRDADLVVEGNYLVGEGQIISMQQWNNATISGNTFVGSGLVAQMEIADDWQAAGVTWDGNTYRLGPSSGGQFGVESDRMTFQQWQGATGFDTSSQVIQGYPDATEVFVRPNRYEAGRANIIIYNWSLDDLVEVDVSGILQPGTKFELRDVQNFFAEPVLSGVYNGSPLMVPMAAVEVVAPIGYEGTVSRGQDFGVFVVMPGGMALIGDITLDGVVDITDLGALAASWQASGPDIGWANGDFSGDGVVDMIDLGALAANWQAGAGTISAPVPEPGTLALLAGVGLALIRRRGL